MKRFITIIVAAMLLLSLVSCGSEKKADDTTAAVQDSVTTEDNTSTSDMSVGQSLREDFLSITASDSAISASDLAAKLLENESLGFKGMNTEIAPGLLTGFGNTEITGFESGASFQPMMSTLPFVGYVFVLADGADADAFIATLSGAADPRWNICTEADETVVEKSGSYVFFVMCPTSFEDAE